MQNLASSMVSLTQLIVIGLMCLAGLHAALSVIIKREESVYVRAGLRWLAAEAVSISISLYVIGQLAGAILVSLYPLFQGWNQAETTRWLEQSVGGQFVFVLAVEAITLGLLWLFLKRRKAGLASLGLKKPLLKDIGYALAGFCAYFVIYLVAIQIAQTLIPGLNLDQKQELGFNMDTSGSLLALVFISLVILPPITEEILMRGFLYTGLRTRLRKIDAAIITSILFAAAHLQAGSGNSLLWVAALDTFILSLVLVYLRDKTDRLWAPIYLHMIKNGLAFSVLFIFKAV